MILVYMWIGWIERLYIVLRPMKYVSYLFIKLCVYKVLSHIKPKRQIQYFFVMFMKLQKVNRQNSDLIIIDKKTKQYVLLCVCVFADLRIIFIKISLRCTIVGLMSVWFSVCRSFFNVGYIYIFIFIISIRCACIALCLCVNDIYFLVGCSRLLFNCKAARFLDGLRQFIVHQLIRFISGQIDAVETCVCLGQISGGHVGR